MGYHGSMAKHTKRKKPDAAGMRGDRTRDKNGELEKKRSDTLIRTLQKKYKVDFPFRADMKLGTALEKTRSKSLKHFLKKMRP